MRIYDFKNGSLFESDDFWGASIDGETENLLPSKKHFNAIVRCFLRRKTFRQLLRGYSKVSGLEGYALVKAHGGMRNGEWTLSDGRRPSPIQNWIDKNDGQYLAILLYVCNPKNQDITSRRSVIVHASDSITIKEVIRGGYFRMYLPGAGYMDKRGDLRKAIMKYR